MWPRDQKSWFISRGGTNERCFMETPLNNTAACCMWLTMVSATKEGDRRDAESDNSRCRLTLAVHFLWWHYTPITYSLSTLVECVLHLAGDPSPPKRTWPHARLVMNNITACVFFVSIHQYSVSSQVIVYAEHRRRPSRFMNGIAMGSLLAFPQWVQTCAKEICPFLISRWRQLFSAPHEYGSTAPSQRSYSTLETDNSRFGYRWRFYNRPFQF